MARRGRGTSGVRLDEDVDGGGLALDTESPLPPTGPHDGDDLDPEVTDAAGLVDFGSIRVPVPPDGTVTVEPTANGRMQAVHIALPEGRLSVSALAAPKTSKLWPELAGEIDGSLRESGARVRSFPGHWGRELHATSGGATSVFVGVDGARWMLYGVATGPSAHAAPLDAELRRMLRGTVVMRGKQPYPVRTILPLTVPDHLEAEAEAEATPAVTATGSKKRLPAKAGAGKSAPGKAAPGNTAPPNSDATTAAAKKAAARRAAARKAAAAAAVKAAAEALAEQAAEDRAAAGERSDTGSAVRNGAYPASGTIPTGPGPDAPLREQAPSARRAAAAAWRSRPMAPGSEDAPPTEALPFARPVGDPPVTEVFPAAAEALPPTDALPPTEALRLVEPGSGGRRRLGEPAPAPPGGRRRLQESPVEEPHPGGRRRLREPAPDMPSDRRYPRDPEIPAGGRRRLPEPNDALGATAPWDLNEPGGRRRLHEPVAEPGGSASSRRREPWDEPERGAGQQPDRLNGSRRPPEPSGAPDTGVSASGRRRLRESWEPSEPVADTGVSASGRRRLREPRDEAGPGTGSRPLETGSGGLNGSGGRRRLGESPEYPEADSRDAGPAPGAAVADTGVSASGRRRLREPWDEAGPLDGRAGSNGSVADTGVSASGRRRLREPRDEAGPGTGSPWETGSGGLNGSGGRRRSDESPGLSGAADTGVSASGRRRLRESWDEAGPDAGWTGTGEPEAGGRRRRDPLGEPGQTGAAADTGVSASGRRRLREPWESAGPAADTGVSASGRRRLREPWDEGGPGPDGLNGSGGRLRSSEPDPAEPTGRRRRAMDVGEDSISGTGGRRRLREPEPAPARDGSQTEPWPVSPGSPPDRGARRTLSAEYLIDTGEQDAGWAAAFDDHAERRDGGRHSGADDGSPPTVRLETLLGELDPNRPRRRHRR